MNSNKVELAVWWNESPPKKWTGELTEHVLLSLCCFTTAEGTTAVLVT